MLALLYFSTRSSFWVLSSSTSSSNWAMRLSSLRFSSAAKPLKFKSRWPSAILFKSTVRHPYISALRQLSRVPNRFLGIRDFTHLKLGIRDLKQNWDEIRDWKYDWERGAKNNPRDYTKFWVGVTGLKEPYWGTSLLWPLLFKTCIQKVPEWMAPNADVLKASSRAVPLRWGGLRNESKERLGGRLVH